MVDPKQQVELKFGSFLNVNFGFLAKIDIVKIFVNLYCCYHLRRL